MGVHSPQRAALGALGITVVLALVKIAVGFATSSLALLAQALDSVIDVVAIGLVLVAVRIAARPPDESHHYGHGKAENLVAFAQTLFLAVMVTLLVVEAWHRLATNDPIVDAPFYALALLIASIVIDIGRIIWLTRVASVHDSEALRAGALNFATDVGTGAVALGSLVGVRAGWGQADAIGALVVSAVVIAAGYRLGKRSVDVLMDRAPEVRLGAIEAAAARAPGVAEARRVRVRGSGDQLFADVTVAAGRTASLERAHDIAEGVEQAIEKIAPGTDVVVHVEPIGESGTLVERVHAAASRVEGVYEIHNVSIHSFDDAGTTRLHATLHAKSRTGASVEEAHELADHIEAEVKRELGDEVRVDAHIEPLEQTSLGRDVTEDRTDITEALRAAVAEEPEMLDLHDIVVTSSTDGLSVVAHVRGRADLSLARLHDASNRVESHVTKDHPEVASVLIHFEPG